MKPTRMRATVHTFRAIGLFAAICGCTDPETIDVNAGAAQTDPSKLSSRGLYSDIATRTIAANAIEYTPDYALWSDGAEKRRWLILPAGTKIDSSDMSHWKFPVGTKFFKEFSLHGTLLETRLVERVAESGDFLTDYFMATFVWSPEQTDATLTEDGVIDTNGTDHEVPKQKVCKTCHQGEPGAILGFSAVQLSRSGLLTKLSSLLSVDPHRTFAIPGDDVQAKAAGVLHANCGHCHAATGSQPKMRMRFLPQEADLPPESWEMYRTTVGQPVTDQWLGHPASFTERIVPGNPELSAVVYRMETRAHQGLANDQMPPIATKKVDQQGVSAVRAWIARLQPLRPDGDGGAPETDAGAQECDAAAQEADAGAPEADAGVPEADAGPVDGATAGGGAGPDGGIAETATENSDVSDIRDAGGSN